VTLPDGSTVAILIDLLNEKFEKLDMDVQRTVVIVNGTRALPATILNNGDEAFILQLMSGG
jgi:sulfur carrier protein ThiS